jgi:DNA-binding CsgD family transcriptional regulator
MTACFVLSAQAQSTIGIPTIVNYGRQVYGGGNQNSNITQDKDGILYFANNNGVLTFDGTYWRLYPLPNRTVVRSIAIGKDNRVYVGGQEEFGYFSPAANGELVYTSLKSLLSSKDYDFADVWNVMVFEDRVFFRANRRLFEYDLKTVKAHEKVNWIFLGSTGKELLAYEYGLGLVSYKNGRWQPRVKWGALPTNALPRAALQIGRDSILLPTVFSGFYLIHGDTISPCNTPDLNLIAQRNISGATMMADGNIAVTTNIGGCFIINKKGQSIQQFTKEQGIQNNNILSCFLDKDKNLWFGLDNGIDLVVYSNAIKHIFPDKAERNAGYTSMLHNGYLYMGVSTGVYRIQYDATTRKDLSTIKGNFEFVENSGGQVWALSEVHGQLLMGHNKGAYQIKGNRAIPLNDRSSGFWRFQLLQPNRPDSRIIAGNYNGISIYDMAGNGQLRDLGLSAKFESARFVVINNDEVWNAHPYKGLYKISFDAKGQPKAEKYEDRQHILSSNHNKLFLVGKKMILTSDNGIFEYDQQKKDFIRSAFFEKIFQKQPVSYLRQDAKGNIWFTQGKRLGVVDISGNTPRLVHITELDDKILSNGFDEINVIDSANVIVASEKGFYHINYAQYRDSKQPLQSLIRSVWSNGAERRQVFGGYGEGTNIPSISYRNNGIFFEFSAIRYGRREITEYSYYLKGFDKTWSAWSKKTDKDYTNLPAGNYEFQVKSRVNTDSESSIASFRFTILPPWYRTWWAYLLFFMGIFAILYYFYKRQQAKYQRLQMEQLQEQKRKYAERQQQLQYQHQLEIEKNEIEKNEKEIIRLRNEKLQAEVEHKNAELASSAMNLVQKVEMLSKLKDDLLQYKEGIGEKEKGNKEFQKIIKLIDTELNQQEEWEQFAVHFDSVHANYLRNLKEYCPELTVTELKLAAYLRLNLNTKEIAQLLNISVRGVETSRYRLRKKLSLPNEIKLSDFLLRFVDQ